MNALWLVLVTGPPTALLLAAVVLYERRIERRISSQPTPGPSGRVAFLTVPSLDRLQNVAQSSDVLRGRVRSVYTMSLPIFVAGAEGGNDVQSKSGLFIVDTEGAVHEPSGSRHAVELEAIGRQLAAELGVPFDLR